MSLWTAPDGFVLVKLPTGPAWFRPEIQKPVLTFWKRTEGALPLGRVANRHPLSRRFSGRGQVISAPFPGAGTLLVRPCVHGGWWGRLARDLYFGPDRALREIRCAASLEKMGLPTPRIQAVLFYPTGPFFRLEVVSTFISNSRDLTSLLSTRPPHGQRSRIFSAVRRLLTDCHHHGVHHPDLNARNILLSPGDTSGWKAWLLDVDAVRFREPGSPAVDTANRNRLLRSLLKLARHGDLGWSESEVSRLWTELFPRK